MGGGDLGLARRAGEDEIVAIDDGGATDDGDGRRVAGAGVDLAPEHGDGGLAAVGGVGVVDRADHHHVGRHQATAREGRSRRDRDVEEHDPAVVDGKVLFDWAESAGAIAYRVEASSSPMFDVLAWTARVGQSAWAPIARVDSSLYWRVVALGPSDATIATSNVRFLEIPDTTPPTVTAPSRGFVPGTGISSGRIAVRLPWSGSDAGSGIARYELAQQTDGGAWTTVATSLTSPTAARNLLTQHSYRFRVRAVDHAGNTSPWASGPTFRVSRYSENNSRISYSGTWTTTKSSVYWGGAARKSTRAGSKASITFSGRSIAWVARTGPDRGRAEVYVNGKKVKTVDLYSTAYGAQRVVWVGTWSSTASRKVTIRVLGTAGRPRVDLDAFVTTN